MWRLKLAQVGKKALPYLAVAGGVIAVLGWVYDMGGDNREAALRSEMAKAQVAAIRQAESDHKEALATQEADYTDRIALLQERLAIAENKKADIRYVEKIVIDPNCKRLALDVIGMFQRRAD